MRRVPVVRRDPRGPGPRPRRDRRRIQPRHRRHPRPARADPLPAVGPAAQGLHPRRGHQITKDAWNALLKSLEEPPPLRPLHVRLDRAVGLPAGDPVAPPAVTTSGASRSRRSRASSPDPRGRRSDGRARGHPAHRPARRRRHARCRVDARPAPVRRRRPDRRGPRPRPARPRRRRGGRRVRRRAGRRRRRRSRACASSTTSRSAAATAARSSTRSSTRSARGAPREPRRRRHARPIGGRAVGRAAGSRRSTRDRTASEGCGSSSSSRCSVPAAARAPARAVPARARRASVGAAGGGRRRGPIEAGPGRRAPRPPAPPGKAPTPSRRRRRTGRTAGRRGPAAESGRAPSRPPNPNPAAPTAEAEVEAAAAAAATRKPLRRRPRGAACGVAGHRRPRQPAPADEAADRGLPAGRRRGQRRHARLPGGAGLPQGRRRAQAAIIEEGIGESPRPGGRRPLRRDQRRARRAGRRRRRVPHAEAAGSSPDDLVDVGEVGSGSTGRSADSPRRTTRRTAMGMANLQRMAQQMQQEMAARPDRARGETGRRLGRRRRRQGDGDRQAGARQHHDRPDAVDPDDVEMLQDLVVAAVNDALAPRASSPSRRWRASPAGLRILGAVGAPEPRVATPLIEPVARLIEAFARLPGIGPKTAQRLTYHLLRARRRGADARRGARRGPRRGRVLRALLQHQRPGRSARSAATRPATPPAVRRRGAARRPRPRADRRVQGPLPRPPRRDLADRRHRPDRLKIRELLDRADEAARRRADRGGDPRDQPDPRGRGDRDVPRRAARAASASSARIARGIPVGGDLEYADEVTLIRALAGPSRGLSVSNLVDEILLRLAKAGRRAVLGPGRLRRPRRTASASRVGRAGAAVLAERRGLHPARRDEPV